MSRDRFFIIRPIAAHAAPRKRIMVMSIEIERKFTVIGDNWRQAAHTTKRMTQGYLNDAACVARGNEHCSVRIRRAGDEAYLNIKSREVGPHRQEYEYAIPVADAEALLKLCANGLVDKIRHYIRFGEHLWEVDEFLGENVGLVVAEIELRSEIESFEKPHWLGEEVTQYTRYYNMALAHHPYTRWALEEKL